MQQKMKLIGLFAATMLAGSGSAWADSETAHHTPHWAYSGEGGASKLGGPQGRLRRLRAGLTAVADRYPFGYGDLCGPRRDSVQLQGNAPESPQQWAHRTGQLRAGQFHHSGWQDLPVVTVSFPHAE